jgi:GDP-fucose protein O-fucosyltransferase
MVASAAVGSYLSKALQPMLGRQNMAPRQRQSRVRADNEDVIAQLSTYFVISMRRNWKRSEDIPLELQTPRRVRRLYWRWIASFIPSALLIFILVSLYVGAPEVRTSAYRTSFEANAAPVVFAFDVCNGLTNQRISLLHGTVVGILLGAQISFPDMVPFDGMEYGPDRRSKQNVRDVSIIYDMTLFKEKVSGIFRSHWCGPSSDNATSSWCNSDAKSPIISSYSRSEVMAAFSGQNSSETVWKLPLNIRNAKSIANAGLDFLSVVEKSSYSSGLLKRSCGLFGLSVVEGTLEWDLFWRVSDSLEFSETVVKLGRDILRGIGGSSAGAREKAAKFGYNERSRFDGTGCNGQGKDGSCVTFNVVHLRAEDDWKEHCKVWMGLRDGIHRDNCINNTQYVHNTLLSEGVAPDVPLYVSTSLTVSQLRSLSLGGINASLRPLFDMFTVITKDMIVDNLESNWASDNREMWAAVDYFISMRANVFAGNSVSTFSAMMLTDRTRRGLIAWHYNGGGVPVNDAGIVSPKTSLAVDTLRDPLKWVFAIHLGKSSLSQSFFNMVKVAVLSARAKTGLVPVCITTSSRTSNLSRWLVSQNVRVIHHSPMWSGRITNAVNHYRARAQAKGENPQRFSHLADDSDAMIGTFMRMDIPIIGIRDEFVLYTDVDVMFVNPIRWDTILGSSSVLAKAKQENDFSHGRRKFGKDEKFGLPLYFSATSEALPQQDMEDLNIGIMLMNMRSLRDTRAAFLNFVLSHVSRTGGFNFKAGPGDQGAYKVFYANRDGRVRATMLPLSLNWKTYWPASDPSIVHFHGPKCELHISPYVLNKTVNVPLFNGLLARCVTEGDCVRRCAEFESYLSEQHLPVVLDGQP